MGDGFFGRGRALGGSNADSFLECDIRRYAAGSFSACSDFVIQECALGIAVNGRPYRSSACSPWDIEELAVGILALDGVISRKEDIIDIGIDKDRCRIDVDMHVRRRSLDDGGCVGKPCRLNDGFSIEPGRVSELAALLETQSRLFHRTGGVHSAVLVGCDGVEAWFEDIGRHSAVDKLAGWCVLNDVSPSDKILVFSGRVPYEIIAKVAAMGWPLVISPGAPTDLSIEAARAHGITLVGFAKEGRFNVYSHSHRIRFADSVAVAC